MSFNKVYSKKKPRKTRIYDGETGKYKCTITDAEGNITEKEMWLFKGDKIYKNIEVGEAIPGTHPDEWSTDYDDEGILNLMAGITKCAISDWVQTDKWISKYPKRHKRLHLKYRKGMTTPNQLYNGYTGYEFVKGTAIADQVRHGLKAKGMDYDIAAIYESWLGCEKEDRSHKREDRKSTGPKYTYNTDVD